MERGTTKEKPGVSERHARPPQLDRASKLSLSKLQLSIGCPGALQPAVPCGECIVDTNLQGRMQGVDSQECLHPHRT